MIDLTKVTRSALEHASSIGALMPDHRSDGVVIPEKKSSAPMPGGGHGPEMDY